MPAGLKAHVHRQLFLVARHLSRASSGVLRHLIGQEALLEVTSHFITDNFVKCDSEIEDRKVIGDVGRESHKPVNLRFVNFPEKLAYI